MSTAVDNAIAFPHVRGVEGGALNLALGVSKKGIKFGGPGGKRDWAPGDVVRRNGYEVTILESRGARPMRLRVRFDAPLDQLQLGRFERSDTWRLIQVRP